MLHNIKFDYCAFYTEMFKNTGKKNVEMELYIL